MICVAELRGFIRRLPVRRTEATRLRFDVSDRHNVFGLSDRRALVVCLNEVYE